MSPEAAEVAEPIIEQTTESPPVEAEVSSDAVFAWDFNIEKPDIGDLRSQLNPSLVGAIDNHLDTMFKGFQNQAAEWKQNAETYVRQQLEESSSQKEELQSMRDIFELAEKTGDSVVLSALRHKVEEIQSEYSTHKTASQQKIDQLQTELNGYHQREIDQQADDFINRHSGVFNDDEKIDQWSALCEEGFDIETAATLAIMDSQYVDRAKGISKLGWTGSSLLQIVEKDRDFIAEATSLRNTHKIPNDLALELAEARFSKKQQEQNAELQAGQTEERKVRFIKRVSSAARNLSGSSHRKDFSRPRSDPQDPNQMSDSEAISDYLNRKRR